MMFIVGSFHHGGRWQGGSSRLNPSPPGTAGKDGPSCKNTADGGGSSGGGAAGEEAQPSEVAVAGDANGGGGNPDDTVPPPERIEGSRRESGDGAGRGGNDDGNRSGNGVGDNASEKVGCLVHSVTEGSDSPCKTLL
eukprot:2006696-Pleurochrysis_carterae.AAC.6